MKDGLSRSQRGVFIMFYWMAEHGLHIQCMNMSSQVGGDRLLLELVHGELPPKQVPQRAMIRVIVV